MDLEFKDKFLIRWQEYFGAAELPIVFQYTNNGIQAEPALSSSHERCMVHMLQHVRDGRSLRFFARSFGCAGGKFSAGYMARPREQLGPTPSNGTQAELCEERCWNNPELVERAIALLPWYEAPASHMVFKRWDALDVYDEPDVAIFFATPDILAGLCALAGFDEPVVEDVVITPVGPDCAAIVQYPYAEKLSGRHRAVLGMFAIAARTHVESEYLTFAVTIERFQRMVDGMDECFRGRPAWAHVRKRIQKTAAKIRRPAVVS